MDKREQEGFLGALLGTEAERGTVCGVSEMKDREVGEWGLFGSISQTAQSIPGPHPGPWLLGAPQKRERS